MKNLQRLIQERGLKQDYLIEQLGVSRSTFIRKRKEGTFTFEETKQILEILGRVKPVAFEDLDKQEELTGKE